MVKIQCPQCKVNIDVEVLPALSVRGNSLSVGTLSLVLVYCPRCGLAIRFKLKEAV